MKRVYRLTRSAKRDLQEISDYWVGRAGPDVALTIMTGIVKTIITLSSQPNAGVLAPQFGSGVRKFPARDHVVYYRASGSAKIEILHVFHGARNQERAWRSG
ncbi:MAG: type II toxin-antitoxin system RelE/ParE family toxin [Acidobacteriia bacterium]|nr:type II toxin-antitoxin system RelE/ParE family toxin [Terriglobia bacterium]